MQPLEIKNLPLFFQVLWWIDLIFSEDISLSITQSQVNPWTDRRWIIFALNDGKHDFIFQKLIVEDLIGEINFTTDLSLLIPSGTDYCRSDEFLFDIGIRKDGSAHLKIELLLGTNAK